ncbi:MAG TPA: glycerol-3-phosphate dehydrogenase/oxidase [Chitinophagaceae bacterium]|nr:glycerol-3-phosphate dehydrogenase/oxidase [Chitinophagaceae bacterium]
MKRIEMINMLRATPKWDICIIGGGATGLGIAVDAASRGLKTLLVEKSDFAKGTSSRSTKLVHGGVRYLQQGNIKLVTEALKERGVLLKNAPHLVKNQAFIVPNYKWWEGPYYGIGLKVYDWMAGSLGFGPSQFLSREETLALAPTLDAGGLRGGVLYHDGQFDDARLAIHLAMTAADHGATIINYVSVEGLLKANGKVSGVALRDELADSSAASYEITANVVINATGVFTDSILKMDDSKSDPLITLSQGIHIIVDRRFLPSDTAILIPRTNDKRVLFAVPWHDKIIIGTTDTPVSEASSEPTATNEEIDFVLQHIQKYLTKDPERSDIRSVFAGLRPLVKGQSKTTAGLSRDHLITISDSELITVTGGKWTTYRKMAEDVLEIAIHKLGLTEKPVASTCQTKDLAIHGYRKDIDFTSPLYYYGEDEPAIREMILDDKVLGEKIHPLLPFVKAQIVWAVHHEMCMRIEDFLSRRSRALLLDARAAIESAPLVAEIMAKEMGKDSCWAKTEIDAFNSIAKNYLPASNLPAGQAGMEVQTSN